MYARLKFSVLCVLVAATPLMADIELQTSIMDVAYRGSDEVAGSITLSVQDDDFAGASEEEPIYIRITLDHNGKLSRTLVDQASADPALATPIYLAATSYGNDDLPLTMGAEDIRIVRWVAGERSLWLGIFSDGSTWVDGGAPTPDNYVRFSIGIRAELSVNDRDNTTADKRSLPFNTRNSELAFDTEETDQAEDTSLRVDLSDSSLAIDGIESLLRFDIIGFDHHADVGNGEFSGAAGFPVGVDFTNDFNIGRGRPGSPSAPAAAVFLPHLTQPGANFECLFILTNTSQVSRSYELIAYDEDGEAQMVSGTIDAEATIKGTASEFFGQDLGNMGLTNATGLSLSVTYKAKGGNSSVAHVHASDTFAMNRLFYTGGKNTWDGLAIFNMGNNESQVIIQQMNEDGSIVATYSHATPLEAKEKLLINLADHFDFEENSRFHLYTTQKTAVTALRGDVSGRFLWENETVAY